MKLFILASRIFFGASLVFFAATVHSEAADDFETPTIIKGVIIISADEAKGMLGAARFFDIGSVRDFARGHVPGAVQLSGKWNSENATNADLSSDDIDFAKLPNDKNSKMIFYGQDTKSWKAYKASLIAAKAGYKNVFWMRSGFSDWKSKGFSIETISKNRRK